MDSSDLKSTLYPLTVDRFIVILGKLIKGVSPKPLQFYNPY